MLKKCFFCGSTKLSPDGLLNKEWIVENQSLNQQGQILKELTIGSTSPKQVNREIIKTVYYCSINCMHQQQNQEETEDFSKGKCEKCKIDLVVLNKDCQAIEHLKEMKYMAITTGLFSHFTKSKFRLFTKSLLKIIQQFTTSEN